MTCILSTPRCAGVRRALATMAIAFACLTAAHAQPVLLSVSPGDGTMGVSPTAKLVFTFNVPMDTSLTSADIYDVSTFTPVPATAAWSAGNTVLTYTAIPSFGAGKTIYWDLTGEDTYGIPLDDASGVFFTASGSSTGSGTNAITFFMVSKVHYYQQSSASAPVVDPEMPYNFMALTSLASNRTANTITVALPNGSISNLFQLYGHPEEYGLFYTSLVSNQVETTFPNGTYTFSVTSTSNQIVPVNLPASLQQPNPPQISNFAAAQAVDPAQPFTLTWTPFQNGTANDYIYVQVGTNFQSAPIFTPAALKGTATSVTIPGNTLAFASDYTAMITFYRVTSYTSNAVYATAAYRGTETDFPLVTKGSSLTCSNPSVSSGTFRFDVACQIGQTLTIEYRTNLAIGQWTKLYTTNTTTPSIRVSSAATVNPARFFRVRTGL